MAIEAVELRGPGLPDWSSGRRILAGDEPHRPGPVVLEAPPLLSAAERRRAIPSVKLALAVATGCVAHSGHDPRCLPTVFASSGPDGETIAAIQVALAAPAREVSPTRFHNSVHNAPSGYWGVATDSRQAVTSLSSYDSSFAAGLLEAAVQAAAHRRATLLVAYDLPYPAPLDGVRPISAVFGVAFVVGPLPCPRALATMRLAVGVEGEASRCADPGLEALRCANPAARSLPLLTMLAGGSIGCVRLAFNKAILAVEVLAC